jgi:microcystin-dependent protein
LPDRTLAALTPACNPPGVVLDYAGSTAPDGYLMCDGSAVSRTTYATLYEAIGDTYGTGDGSTTFNLPTATDVFVLGKGTIYSTLGATGGEAYNNMPPYLVLNKIIKY